MAIGEPIPSNCKGSHTNTYFFFKAEDGIRDLTVTGVQTCALPISGEPVEIRSPYNGEVAGITFMASAHDVEAAGQGAAGALQENRKLPASRRVALVGR